ncbi:hypothetical protein PPL_03319 [Heterostelium album PN500]|uniref:Uncharacterized protein n=1 Tax=Heterostelium pallidum (strain ATCC 26659 / Pp 5 / PN500) TaxID=670386 RepID=D3B4J4_HETP5|nr:hypothetical protein PPL_03319 [Heterostelium album PN500]EFA84242.1 hypothetical protein PPL_03319 [Heterostelium album PN500]|eukprot:XP_020436358.1 hypothetical protein PPL_03319 [Heterostelium album PN500]
MNNSQQTFTRDELIEFTKDQLFKICVDNKIKVNKSSNKSLIIDHIINFKEEKDRLQKKLIDDNPSNQFHRGHVEYKLPVMIITKILRYCWDLSTWYRHSPLYSYREALKLTLINKQFFGVVSLMYTKVNLRSLSRHSFFNVITFRSSPVAEQVDRLTSVWCPVKHIVKLMINTYMFEQLMKQKSAHLIHVLSTIEKLHIYHENNCRRLSAISIKALGIIAKPRSLYLRSILMDTKQMDAICLIKSLRKIDIYQRHNDHSDYFTVLCKGLPLLESLKTNTLDISCIPKSSQSAIKKLSSVYLNYTNGETFEFPNLQKLTVAKHNPLLIDNLFFKYFSQSNNMTYLSIHLNHSFNIWLPIIIQLKSLVTLEDSEPHRQKDCKEFNSKLKDVILPASLSRIIISTIANIFISLPLKKLKIVLLRSAKKTKSSKLQKIF